MKKCIFWLLTLSILFSITISASAEGGGPITGKFTPILGPKINSIEILDESNNVPLSLTPNTYYLIKVTVSDTSGIGDLSNVQMKMWFDGTGEKTMVDEEDDFDPDTTYAQIPGYKRIQFQWDNIAQSPFRKRYAYATNWDIDQYGYPTSTQLANKDITSFPFIFRIKISRGALEAKDGGVWQIAAKAVNAAEMSDYMVYDEFNPGMLVNWYGEMVVPQGSKVDWGKVVSGMTYTEIKSHQVIPGMEYFSNGDYSVRVKSSKLWERTGGGTAAVFKKNALTSGSFAIRSQLGPVSSGTIVDLDDTGSFTDVKEGAGYGEENVDVPDIYNNVYLTVNSELLPGTYTGLLTYGIVNR